MSTSTLIIGLSLFALGCTSNADPSSDMFFDTGQDIIFEDLTVDVREIIDLERKNLPESCSKDLECPRGSTCNTLNQCTHSTGCGALWGDFVPDDTACYYDHDRDPCEEAGNFTAKECDEDSECPGKYLCIRRVCHLADRCIEGECKDGFICASNIICVESSRCPSRM